MYRWKLGGASYTKRMDDGLLSLGLKFDKKHYPQIDDVNLRFSMTGDGSGNVYAVSMYGDPTFSVSNMELPLPNPITDMKPSELNKFCESFSHELENFDKVRYTFRHLIDDLFKPNSPRLYERYKKFHSDVKKKALSELNEAKVIRMQQLAEVS